MGFAGTMMKMPFSVPQALGSGMWLNVPQAVKGGMSYTRTQRKRRRRFKKRVGLKRKIINTLPAKHNTFETNVTMLANAAYTICPTKNITQGTGNQNRLGDDVFLEALRLKGNFESDTEANAYSFRLIVGFTGEEITPTNVWSSAGLTAAELYQPNTFNILTSGLVNKKAATILLDEIYDINSQVNGARSLHSYDVLVPLKQKFLYQVDGGVFGKTKNLFVWIVGYAVDKFGVTPIGRNYISVDLIFKD